MRLKERENEREGRERERKRERKSGRPSARELIFSPGRTQKPFYAPYRKINYLPYSKNEARRTKELLHREALFSFRRLLYTSEQVRARSPSLLVTPLVPPMLIFFFFFLNFDLLRYEILKYTYRFRTVYGLCYWLRAYYIFLNKFLWLQRGQSVYLLNTIIRDSRFYFIKVWYKCKQKFTLIVTNIS